MANDLAIYDDVAAAWWSDEIRWVRTLKNMVPARLAWFENFTTWDGCRVLDLGCAGGFMAEELAHRGAIVTGIDPAEKAIDAAQARARQMGQAIRYDVGVGEALPYATGAFDAVVCVDVLEHVNDLPAVLAEVYRVLKPGGQFFYDTINRNPIAKFAAITVAEDVLELLPKGTHAYDMFIKPRELLSALEGAGLVPGAQKGLGPRGLNRRGDFLFGRVPSKSVIYMGIARKPKVLQ